MTRGILSGFEGPTFKDPVAMAEWTHLNSYRTQKLSTPAATIVGPAPAKIARCRVIFICLGIRCDCTEHGDVHAAGSFLFALIGFFLYKEKRIRRSYAFIIFSGFTYSSNSSSVKNPNSNIASFNVRLFLKACWLACPAFSYPMTGFRQVTNLKEL